MRAFCTIITSNYFAFAVSLYRSLVKFHLNEKLVVLICDEGLLNPPPETFPGIIVLPLKDILHYKETASLYEKYSGQHMDAFRWSMKSVLIRYLLEHGYEKVIFVDPDVFFFNNYEFLFDQLDTDHVLLTPSWRTIDYRKSEEEFINLYTDGLYNAGFIAANKNGIPAIEWWTKACLYKIDIDREHGLFVDQKYLDAMPLMFKNITAVIHKGCNISVWNQIECQRTLKGGQVYINGTDPVIFIHFNGNYIKELIAGNDQLLFPYFKRYESVFAQSGYLLTDFVEGLSPFNEAGVLKKIKHKTLIRTRFKKIMHKLIDKI